MKMQDLSASGTALVDCPVGKKIRIVTCCLEGTFPLGNNVGLSFNVGSQTAGVAVTAGVSNALAAAALTVNGGIGLVNNTIAAGDEDVTFALPDVWWDTPVLCLVINPAAGFALGRIGYEVEPL